LDLRPAYKGERTNSKCAEGHDDKNTTKNSDPFHPSSCAEDMEKRRTTFQPSTLDGGGMGGGVKTCRRGRKRKNPVGWRKKA